MKFDILHSNDVATPSVIPIWCPILTKTGIHQQTSVTSVSKSSKMYSLQIEIISLTTNALSVTDIQWSKQILHKLK